MSNLRQIGVGLVLWSDDHSNRFPWQVSIANGGSMEAILSGQVSPHFQLLSDYYLKQPRIFVCPTDHVKYAATNFSEFAEQNFSYFINLEAATNSPFIVLSGDRHLQFDGQPVKPGLRTPPTNGVVGWTSELHTKSSSKPGGNVLFSDGHVEWNTSNLSTGFQHQSFASSRLAIP